MSKKECDARRFDRMSGPRYAAELDQAADILGRIHPIGQVKGIGRLEVVRALTDVAAELIELRKKVEGGDA
jgi:hypothetical protein